MKRTLRTTAAVFLATGAAAWAQVTVYENTYNSEAPGSGFGAWNWGDNTTHTATYVDIGGGDIAINHDGAINNTTAAAFNSRFGSKWDIALTGNTSLNPADYVISLDLRLVSGNWDPMNIEFFVLTKEGGGDMGFGSGALSYSIADGWVHVEKRLDELAATWWQGTSWNLSNPNWSLEIGGPPWPGNSVEPGVSFTQTWQMDNLRITMVPEPSSATIAVACLALAAARRQFRRIA